MGVEVRMGTGTGSLGGEREVPDDNSTAGAAFSCPALQGTEGNQARASEAKNG